MSAAEKVHTFAPRAPAFRPPQNADELNTLLAERMRDAAAEQDAATANAVAAATPIAPPALAPAGTALPLAALQEAQEAHRLAAAPLAPPPAYLPILAPSSESEARARLAEAIQIRDAAYEAKAKAEAAVVLAKDVVAQAEATAATSITTELRGADDLARRIVGWAVSGGERPDLDPDAESLDARREQDRARVHADAARQAVRALAIDLDTKQHVFASAEAAVAVASHEVVAALIEDVAKAGDEAERIYRRAQQACRVVYGLGGTGAHRRIRMRSEAMRLGECGMLGTSPLPASAGTPEEHSTAWGGLLTALRSNPNAVLE